MTTDTRTCLTCGRPHGVDGWNPRHPARYYEPTRPVVNMPHDEVGSHSEREYKFTTNRFAHLVEHDLITAGFEPVTLTHVYVSPTERHGRREALNDDHFLGPVTFMRTVKAAPPASEDITPGTPLVRQEDNGALSAMGFATSAAAAITGKVPFLIKRRYDIPLDDDSGLVCEVDVYAWPPDAPLVAEVELPAGVDRVITPADLPAVLSASPYEFYEVTQDPSYYAANIAARIPT